MTKENVLNDYLRDLSESVQIDTFRQKPYRETKAKTANEMIRKFYPHLLLCTNITELNEFELVLKAELELIFMTPPSSRQIVLSALGTYARNRIYKDLDSGEERWSVVNYKLGRKPQAEETDDTPSYKSPRDDWNNYKKFKKEMNPGLLTSFLNHLKRKK